MGKGGEARCVGMRDSMTLSYNEAQLAVLDALVVSYRSYRNILSTLRVRFRWDVGQIFVLVPGKELRQR